MLAPSTNAILLLTLLLVGCEPPQPSQDTAVGPGCSDGFVADSGSCVPVGCGEGPWGDLEVDGSTVFVNVGAPAGGDGSETAPLRSIQEGLDLAGSAGGAMVAVARGIYAETLSLTTDHAGVRLSGRCRELVTLDASGGDDSTAGIEISVGQGEVDISGLTVRWANWSGVRARSGLSRLVDVGVHDCAYCGVLASASGIGASLDLELQDCSLTANAMVGLLGEGGVTRVSIVDSVVSDSVPETNGTLGYGIYAYNGASLHVEGCEITGNTESGVQVRADGTEVTLYDCTIASTLPGERVGYGAALLAGGGGAMHAQGCELFGNRGLTAMIAEEGTVVTLTRCVLRDTLESEAGAWGFGASVTDGASLLVADSAVSGNQGIGILADGSGTRVELYDSAVRDTRATASGGMGIGVLVREGAALFADSSNVTDNRFAGLHVTGVSTEASLRHCRIAGTDTSTDAEFAFGAYLVQGAALGAEVCEFSGNAGVGIAAYDAGTLCTMRDCAVLDNRLDDNWESGLGLDAGFGAEVQLDRCELVGNTTAGIMARGDATELTVRDSLVQETNSDPLGIGGAGIGVQGGARLAASGCSLIGNMGSGLQAAERGTVVRLHDVMVSDTRIDSALEVGYGLQVSDGATLSAARLAVARCDTVGVWISGEGTRATLADSSVVDTREGWRMAGHGVEVGADAALELVRCEVLRNVGIGLLADGQGTRVRMVDCWVGDTSMDGLGRLGRGVAVQGGASLVGRGTEISGNAMRGIGVIGASLFVDDCLVNDNGMAGIAAVDSGTMVSATDTTISGTTLGADELSAVAFGVYAQDGANVALERIVARDNEGPGLYAVGEGASIACTDCSVLDNQFAGIAVVDYGAAVVDASTISSTRGSVNLGGGVGIFGSQQGAYGAPSVHVSETTIADHPVAGAYFAGQGAYDLSGNIIQRGSGVSHGTGTRCGDGVFATEVSAWDGSRGLLLERNSIAENRGIGVFLDEAWASLSGNEWAGNHSDLLVQGEACLSPLVDYEEVPVAEICPEWDQPVCELEFTLDLVVEGVDPARAIPSEGAGVPDVGLTSRIAAPVAALPVLLAPFAACTGEADTAPSSSGDCAPVGESWAEPS